MGILEINDAKDEIILSAYLYFYGSKATPQLAQVIANDINYYWSLPKAKVNLNNKSYTLVCSCIGIYAPMLTREKIEKNTNALNNYFRIEENNIHDVSFVDGAPSNTGYFKLKNLIEFERNTTGAHEFGHTLGLDDLYDDLRGKGVPGIMYPRGTIVDAQYQWNPNAEPGDGANGGTMNSIHRRVRQADVDNLKINELNFENGKAIIGKFSNVYHESHV